MLRKLYEDEKPEYVAISFDVPGPTFRHEEYKEYKANRKKMDDDLAVQVPYVRRVCEVYRLPILDVPGFEADDVIATLTRQATEQGFRVVVVSGDKDLLQLVNDQVQVLNPGREGMGAVALRRQEGRGEVGRAARAGGGHPRPHGRRGGQHPRGARHRRQGRARPHPRVRLRGGRARSGRRGEARRLPRGAPEPPRGRAPQQAPRHPAPGRPRHPRRRVPEASGARRARRPSPSSASSSSRTSPASTRPTRPRARRPCAS